MTRVLSIIVVVLAIALGGYYFLTQSRDDTPAPTPATEQPAAPGEEPAADTPAADEEPAVEEEAMADEPVADDPAAGAEEAAMEDDPGAVTDEREGEDVAAGDTPADDAPVATEDVPADDATAMADDTPDAKASDMGAGTPADDAGAEAAPDGEDAAADNTPVATEEAPAEDAPADEVAEAAEDAPDAEAPAAVETAPALDVAALSADIPMGEADAPITVIEYGSFTCPHCAAFSENVFGKLKANYIDTGKVRFIHREVYFDRFGLWAGMVARCGGPLRYYGIVEMIYETQHDWIGSGENAEVIDNLKRLGRMAGLGNDQIDACLKSEPLAEALVAAYQTNAEADEITGTPSFIINGEKHPNMSYASFAEILDGLLAE